MEKTNNLDYQGTIPVPYRGQNYNIPVSLYLLDTHPYHAPLCYVKPTPDMQVGRKVGLLTLKKPKDLGSR